MGGNRSISCIIITPGLNNRFVCERTIPSIVNTTEHLTDWDVEIIVVDNSGEQNFEYYCIDNGYDDIIDCVSKVVGSESNHLPKAFNKGVKSSKNEYIAIFHDDCTINDKLWVEKMVNKLKLENNVIFTGLVTENEKLELLESASLFVLTSHSDVHPIAVQDALAMSLPVVITQACDYPEVLNYDAGVIVNEDVNQITDAILGIINELRRVGTLTLKNSISGWNIFVGHYIIGEIKNILEKETLLAKQKLAFMKFYESLGNFDYDIPLLISNRINPEIIIPKEEV